MNGRIKRPDALLAAVCLGLLATTGRAFYPTDPPMAYGLSGLLGLYAVYQLARGLWALPSIKPGALRWGLYALHLPLGLALGVMVAHSAVMTFILSGLLLCVSVLILLAWLIGVGASYHRGRLSASGSRAHLWVILSLCAGAYVGLCAYIWHQPDPADCAEASAHPAITRLSPERYPAMRSFPYELAMLGDTGRIAASFKMAGNLTIRPWDNPEANRLVVIDPADLSSPQLAELELGGEALPQYMVYHPERQQVVLNRLGFGEDWMEVIDVGAFPELRRSRRAETVDQPHAMHLLKSGEILVTTMRREVHIIDYDSLTPTGHVAVPTWFATPGFTFTDLTLSPGREVGFASTLGTDVVRIDPKGVGQVRHRGRGFGAGEILHHPSKPEIFETDFFQNRVRVIDSRTLETLRDAELGFAPRPVAVMETRGLIAVGDWFRGEVHLLDIETLKPQGEPIPVGRYLREFALDSSRGRLYTGSTCGVYALELDKLKPLTP